MGKGSVMGNDSWNGMPAIFNPYGNPIQPRIGGMQLAQDPEDFQEGVQGQGGGQMGGMGNFMKTPWGSMLGSAGMGLASGRSIGESFMNAGMGTAKNELLKYGLTHGLGTALGGKALGALGGPWGMAAMAAMPMISKGLSSLGRTLGIGGGHRGPSAQEMAMGEAKGNLAGMRGTYGADMGAGQALRDKYNPMIENQIGRMQELADRGLSTEYNTRQMAGAAANTENARRAAEARMKATSGMIGGGQAVSGFGGINQAAVGGMAQGAYNAAQTNMNSQPGYIQTLANMAGSQVGRGDNYYNMGRSGMMGLDQSLYSLNAQEKARADALSQANRDREANMIGGVMNMAGTAMGMEQSRRANNEFLTALGLRPNANSGINSGNVNSSPVRQTPTNPDGSYSVMPDTEGSFSPEYYQAPDNRQFGTRSPEEENPDQSLDPRYTQGNMMNRDQYMQFLQQMFGGSPMSEGTGFYNSYNAGQKPDYYRGR
jgi:hypothetical protein